jgi:hypothetical protein
MKHALLFFLLSAGGAAAQQSDSAALSPFLQKLQGQPSAESLAEQVAPGDTAFQHRYAEATRQAMLVSQEAELAQHRYRRATFNYYTESLRHRSRVFTWQHTSGVITFGIVVLIVLAGLSFSGIQFYIAMKDAQARAALRRKNRLVLKDEEDDLAVTKLELSLQGVKVNSSVLGVIILVVSLGFFYLYLAYVFPITETNFGASEMKAEKEAIEQSVPTE